MPFIVVAQGLTILREATYLTDAGVAAANGLQYTEAVMTIADEYDGSRADVKHGAAGTLPPAPHGGRTVGVKIVTELKGKGSAVYTDPLALPLYHMLLGAGLSGVISGNDIVITPVRPDTSGSFTADWYTASERWKILGIRGSVIFRMDAKRRGFAEFNGEGVMAPSYPVELALPAITYAHQTVMPPVFVGGDVSLGTYVPVLSAFQVGLANAISARNDANLAGGHAGFLLTDRVASWQFPGEAVLLGTYNPFSASISGTVAALSATLGAVAGNQFTFAGAKASVDAPGQVDESGRIVWGLGGGLHITNGNDEFTLTVEG